MRTALLRTMATTSVVGRSGRWRLDPKPEDGTPKAIAELRALAVSVANEIDEVPGLGIAARIALERLHAEALAVDPGEADLLFEPLSLRIHEAEATKVVQLETEAVNIDAVLQVRVVPFRIGVRQQAPTATCQTGGHDGDSGDV